ncbi:MAG TPA: dihydropteroate synthase [Bacteroidetes bacterium]|nr:dihydropteroate synthase [Bacteroidota bacterium]
MKGKDTFFSRKRTLNLGGRLVRLDRPLVMGVLNLTPDSFYAGSRSPSPEAALARTEAMLAEGADIIDAGALSSRPGAVPVSEKEECSRLFPVLEIIRKKYPDCVLSVDTFRSGVARDAVRNFGVQMINDISGGHLDPGMWKVVAEENLPYVMMHMKGSPENMQQQAVYNDLMGEITAWFSSRIRKLREMGVNDIILDPGFGFSKTLDHNYTLMNRLDELAVFELPLLVGVSRKSMVYKLLNASPEEALNGSTVLHTLALWKGADILRVHDVREARETLAIVERVKQG